MKRIHFEISHVVVLALISIHQVLSSSTFHHVTDECDWVDSSVRSSDDGDWRRTIRPVSLRCSQGRIEWKHPGGALRVTLRLGTSGQRDFRGCVKAGSRYRGVRIYLEGHRTLHLLFAIDDGRHPQLPRCFASHHGQVVLYFEPEVGTGGINKTSTAEFYYDLEDRWTLPDDHWTTVKRQPTNYSSLSTGDLDSDCRPCSDDILTQFYCSSDFAVRGKMLDVCENRDLERTEVKVGAWQVYKQRAAIFAVTGRSSENLFLKRMLRQSTRPRDLVSSVECRICKHCAIDDEETKVMNFNQTLKSKDSRRPVLYLGVVHFPSVCGVQYGTEEFLFLGRLLFDSPVVKCAPRWQEWQRARNNARSRGRLQCDSP